MNNVKNTLTLALLITSFGVMANYPVMDLKSYSYFTRQIENDQQNLLKQAEELETAIDAYNLSKDTADMLQKTYRKSDNLIRGLKSDIERANDKPLKFAESVLDDIDDVDTKAHRDDIRANIEKEYNKGNGWKQTQYSEALANEAMKDVIVQSEEIESYSVHNASLLQELANAANTAANEKEAQDVTNAILLEMLKTQMNLNEVITATSKSFAMAHVTTLDKSIEQAEQEAVDSKDAEETDYSDMLSHDPSEATQSIRDKMKNMK